jgi:hypothetical protein
MISFGTPCCGDSVYTSLVSNVIQNNIRVVNHNDVVPVFLEFIGYEHSGNIIVLEDEGKVSYEKSKKLNDLKDILLSVIINFFPYLGSNLIKYHSFYDYNNKLDTLI